MSEALKFVNTISLSAKRGGGELGIRELGKSVFWKIKIREAKSPKSGFLLYGQ